jgi:hypothetical protein
MSSDSADGEQSHLNGMASESVEYLLFDSLVHQLIEKGLLTKNNAFSVVQTVAEVVRSRMHESEEVPSMDPKLRLLERIYGSFEALPERYGRSALNGDNVLPLRTPLHGDSPHFPSADDD